MIYIGVTGGIGSGKSTVCSFFEKKGIQIFLADTVAKEIVNSNVNVFDEIIDLFGSQVLDTTNKLNRKVIAEIVFHDKKLLEELNAIVHPRVFDEYGKWKERLSKNITYVLVESAILFESGFFEVVDYSLAVMADENIRVQRVLERDKGSVEQIISRMKHQISTEELLELSDFQIHNNGSINDLMMKVNFFHTLFSTLTHPQHIE